MRVLYGLRLYSNARRGYDLMVYVIIFTVWSRCAVLIIMARMSSRITNYV